MLTRYTQTLGRSRLLLLLMVVGILVVAVTGFEKLEFDTTYRIWFEEDSPHLAQYDELLARFGSDDSALIVLAADQPLIENDALGAIQALTTSLWAVDGVKRVDALTNFSIVRASRVQHESAALAVTDTFVAAAGDRDDIFVFRADGRSNRLTGHAGIVEHLAASPDGQTLFSAALDRTVRAWDVPTGHLRFTARELPHTISALLYDAGRLYVGTRGMVAVFDARTGVRVATYQAGEEFVTHLFIHNGTLWAVARDVLRVDLAAQAVVQTPGSRPALAASFDRATSTLFTAHDDGSFVRHDATSSTVVYRADVPLLAIAQTEAGVVLGAADGTLHFVDQAGVGRVERRHNDWVTDIVADGDRIITASRDRDVIVSSPTQSKRLTVHRAAVRHLALHGDQLFTLGDDGDLYVFDTATWELVARHRRSAPRKVGARAVADLSGPRHSTLEVRNLFRVPVEARVGGRVLGTVVPGAIARFEGLPIAEEMGCLDRDCEASQYCDYEREEPTCTTVAPVTLYASGGVAIDTAEAFLRPDRSSRIELPSDDAFSVTEAVSAPIPPGAYARGFVQRFPSTVATVARVLGAPDVDAFLAPDVARELAARLAEDGAPPKAIAQASTLAQSVMSPDAIPMQPRRLAELRYHLTRPPDRAGLHAVINPALDTSLLVVAVHQPSDDGALERSKRVTRELRTVLADAEASSGFDLHLTGGIVQETVMEEYAQREIDRLLPLFFAVLALMLLVVYRRPAGLLVPLGLVVASIGFSMGLAGHLGASLNNMTVVGPQVVLAACIGDAIHLFNTYSDRLRAGDTVALATQHAVTENFMPCFWTSASTSLGFFSLCTSRVVPVATFGWIAGIGVITAFVLSFTLMPAVMGLLPAPRIRQGAKPRFQRVDIAMEALLRRLAHVVNRHTVSILTVSGIALAVAAYGLTGLHFETSELGAFKDDAPIRIATDLLEERELSGAYGVHLMVDTNTEKGIRKVEHLAQLEKLEAHLWETPALMTITGVTDIQRRMNRVMHQDQPTYHKIPETDREASSNYDAYTFSLESGRNLTHRVSADESATLLDLRFKNQDSTWFLAWGDNLSQWARTSVPGLDVTITGKGWLVTNTVTEIAVGFVKNVGSAVLLISLLVLFAAGSIRIGLPACIANVLPIGTVLGFISLMGSSMDISAILACCVAMGIIVDDTLHFMARYAKLVRAGVTHDDAVVETVLHSGKAMVFTTSILIVGFMIFTLADYTVTVNFGVMASSMLLLGLIFDLTLLPAALRVGGAFIGSVPAPVEAVAVERAGRVY